MAEDFVLTDPITEPPVTTTKYRVVAMHLDLEEVVLTTGEPGHVQIKLRDNNQVESYYRYAGKEAVDLMKWMNTANFSVNSMQKRVLQKLTNDGLLPPGTISGTPDPPTSGDEVR